MVTSNLLFSLLISTVLISTVQALACYEHHNQCVYKPSCLIDENRKTCNDPNETFCFKDDMIFGLAVRGCATAQYCNATVLFQTRHCCSTDYCNHSVIGQRTTWLMIVIMPIIAVLLIRG